MNNLYKIVTVIFCFALSANAQEKVRKIDQSVNVSKDVTIDLNTSHTNIEVETWNKNYVEVQAYVESNSLSKEELENAIEEWDVSLDGSGDFVSITSKGFPGIWSNAISASLFDEESLEALANIPIELDLNLRPLLESLEGLKDLDVLADLPEHLKLLRIPESPDGNYNLDFDFDKYKDEGEVYLDSWSKKYRKEYGEEYEQEMRTWAKSINQEDLDAFERSMEEWGEKFGKQLEETFGKDFEEKMEKWGEELGKNLEGVLEEAFSGLIDKDDNDKQKNKAKLKKKAKINSLLDRTDLKKTIKIKMPKKAKLKLNVKHGELKMVSVLHNLKADIAHGTLLADNIDGSETSINVSFSTIKVNNWNAGELNLNYVESAQLASVKDLMLNSVSSNIDINSLTGNTIIDGSFGDLTVRNILPSFKNLNVVLENSDAKMQLPKTDYNLYFKGKKSRFNNESVGNKTVRSYPNNNNTTLKTIVINAKYSNVIAK